jgi:hypothetical protein
VRAAGRSSGPPPWPGAGRGSAGKLRRSSGCRSEGGVPGGRIARWVSRCAAGLARTFYGCGPQPASGCRPLCPCGPRPPPRPRAAQSRLCPGAHGAPENGPRAPAGWGTVRSSSGQAPSASQVRGPAAIGQTTLTRGPDPSPPWGPSLGGREPAGFVPSDYGDAEALTPVGAFLRVSLPLSSPPSDAATLGKVLTLAARSSRSSGPNPCLMISFIAQSFIVS